MNRNQPEDLVERTFPVTDTEDVEGHRLGTPPEPNPNPEREDADAEEEDVAGHMQPPRDLDIERM